MRVKIKEKRRGKKVIIRNIDLRLSRGTTTLIIGTSGAGKSTLIRCIIREANKYVTFDEGENKIAYIRQHPAMNKDLTVRDSIFYARRFENLFEPEKKIMEKVNYYIYHLGLTGMEERKIRKLSGGQQQRVAIARELIRGANILIADEIDTGLDCGVAHSLTEQLSRATKKDNLITLIISHNVLNIPEYDKVVVIAKDEEKIGGIAYDGKPGQIKDFFSDYSKVKEYWEILNEVNLDEEGGKGFGGYYIRKMLTRGEKGYV